MATQYIVMPGTDGRFAVYEKCAQAGQSGYINRLCTSNCPEAAKAIASLLELAQVSRTQTTYVQWCGPEPINSRLPPALLIIKLPDSSDASVNSSSSARRRRAKSLRTSSGTALVLLSVVILLE